MADVYQRKDLITGKDEQIESVGMLRLVYRDIFDLKYLYVLMHEWFIEQQWVPNRDDEIFPEVMLVHRDFGKDQQIWWRWRFERESPNGKMFRWVVELDMHILGLKQVETVINGQKRKVDSAEVEVFIWPYLFLRKSIWADNPVTDFFTPMLRRVIYRKTVQKEKKLFERAVWQTQEAIKTYFKLETYLPERQLHEFHPHMDAS